MTYYLRKAAGFFVTLLLVSVITFAVFQILPGDPATVILGVDADPVQVRQLQESMGLDQPVHIRFINWIAGVLQGDLGTSYRYHQPVSGLIAGGFSVTVLLALFSLLLTAAIGLPVGVWLAHHSGRPCALPASMLSQLGLSVPAFCVSILLISLFSVNLKWLPSLGFTPWTQSPLDCVKSLLLPSLAIAFGSSAVLMRYVRVSVMQQERQDYVKTAQSKGVGEGAILRKHVLRNSLIPVLTIFGMIITDVLGAVSSLKTCFPCQASGSWCPPPSLPGICP